MARDKEPTLTTTEATGRAHLDDRKLVFGAVFAFLLFIGSGYGLWSVFLGANSRGVFDATPIQKQLRVHADCRRHDVSVSFNVDAKRDDGALTIMLYGSASGRNEFPFASCKDLSLYVYEFASEAAQVAARGAQLTQLDLSRTGAPGGSSWVRLPTDAFDGSEPSITITIPSPTILTQTAADMWGLDLSLVVQLENTDLPPIRLLPFTLSVGLDEALVLDQAAPALARTRPFRGAASTLEIEMEPESFDSSRRRPPSFIGEIDETARAFHTIAETRLILRLRDPDFAVRRDIQILVFSTLFGIAVTVFFETILVLSVRQTVRAIPASLERRLGPYSEDQIAKDNDKPELLGG